VNVCSTCVSGLPIRFRSKSQKSAFGLSSAVGECAQEGGRPHIISTVV